MVQVSELGGPSDMHTVEEQLITTLVTTLGYEHVEFKTEAIS